ncbi:MAG: UTP--glucose-1-phosphate uridylyltransferase GalU [Rhodobacteraceae bacterium]|nr:UTP--glucose-1-phosphate uridylyltransferase GalU [Paracoccaceae bacterium]
MASKIKTAVLPVAGLGTRFLPATKSIPKEIMTLVDRPLIQYSMDEALAAGIEQFIFVTSRGKNALEDYFDRSPILESVLVERGRDDLLETVRDISQDSGRIAYIRQHSPLGLGHAVWCARHLLGNDPFAVILTDDIIQSDQPALGQLIEIHNETGHSVVALTEIDPTQSEHYGLVKYSHTDGSVVAIDALVEKPPPTEAPSNLAVIGRYILTPDILQSLNGIGQGAGQEIQLTDAISLSITNGYPVKGLLINGTRFDCGSKSGYLHATLAIAASHPTLGQAFRRIIRDLQGPHTQPTGQS